MGSSGGGHRWKGQRCAEHRCTRLRWEVIACAVLVPAFRRGVSLILDRVHHRHSLRPRTSPFDAPAAYAYHVSRVVLAVPQRLHLGSDPHGLCLHCLTSDSRVGLAPCLGLVIASSDPCHQNLTRPHQTLPTLDFHPLLDL
ncbi:hypothetical protein GUJ93_ZPchr0012g20109 [Zizania palustris]|uniref:Uncharacterized protein n=1 Tax=Zizania palustris TaxID=103762 RepID=A0A8J5WQ58_ZIZPA|nr:hypothetical protein GUJ93_ZPchr0012g20109 [Zizania palustris]